MSYEDQVPVQPGAAQANKLIKDQIKNYLDVGFGPTPQIQMQWGQGPAAAALQGLDGKQGLGYLGYGGVAANLERAGNQKAKMGNQLNQQQLRNKALSAKMGFRQRKMAKLSGLDYIKAQEAMNAINQQNQFYQNMAGLGQLIGQAFALRPDKATPNPDADRAVASWYPSWQDNLNLGNYQLGTPYLSSQGLGLIPPTSSPSPNYFGQYTLNNPFANWGK